MRPAHRRPCAAGQGVARRPNARSYGAALFAALAGALAAAQAHARPEAEALQESLVQVVAMDADGTPRRLRSGFAVTATGHVLTSAHGVANEDPIVVVPLGTGAELLARVLHSDQGADVALLHATGLELPPLALAKDGFAPGRLVFSAGAWGEADEQLLVAQAGGAAPTLAEGAVGEHGEIAAARGRPSLPLLLHNAMIPAAGYGGPLLNECGEVAGVNRGDPDARTWQLREGQAPDAVVHAAAVSAVAELLQPFLPEGVSFTQSEATCAEGRAAAQAEAEAAAAKAGEAEAKAEEAARQAEQLAEQKDAELAERQEALDAAEARLAELQAQSDEAARTGAAEADSLREDLEAARSEQEAAQTAVREREEELASLRAERAEQEADAEANRLLLTVLAAALVIAAAVVVVLLVIQRRRARETASARQQAARAEREAAQAQEAAEQARGEGSAPGPPIADCLLTGETSAGRPASLKVPGSLLAGQGAVIGRSPRNAALLIDDETLSREHARLRYEPERGLLLEDLDSTNGTRLNGRPLEPRTPTRLANGDVAELGGVKLQVAWAG